MGNACAGYCCQNEAEDGSQITITPQNELFRNQAQHKREYSATDEKIRSISRTGEGDSDGSVDLPYMDDNGEALNQILMEELEQPDPVEYLTVPRDSADFRRASQTKSVSIQDSYRRFHAFIELQIERLAASQDSLLDLMLINTLDGIKRQSTVNLYNLFMRSGKLSRDEQKAGPEQLLLQKTRTQLFRQIQTLGTVDFKQLVYQEMAQLLCCFVPVFRLRRGLYLVGSQTQALDVNDDNEVFLVERVISLEKYLTSFGVIECLRLHKISEQTGLSFKGVIKHLLKKLKADPAEVASFIADISPETEVQFSEVIQLVKEVQMKQVISGQ